MSDFKDKIVAASGKVEFLYDTASGRISQKISRFRATYFVAVSLDGRHLLGTVPATGLGQTPVYPQPSVLTFIQSDEQSMWGRNCPLCKKYFRTNHVDGVNDITICPYCSHAATSLAFISKEQGTYIQAFYDARMRALIGKTNTALDIAKITDETPAWHYSEEKQQFHFVCDTKDCHAETDILGEYGYCPRCGRTNARKLFSERINKMLTRLEETRKTVSDPKERGTIWEDITKACVSDFEAFAKHIRTKLLRFPMTAKRRKRLEAELNFQRPLLADELLTQWFDMGVLEWPGDTTTPKRSVPKADLPFIKQMVQKRHILIHNGGVVDQDYLDKSGDTQVRLGERIRVCSKEAKRFIECVQTMGANFADNVEYGFSEG